MDFDKLFDLIGNFGVRQRIFFALITFKEVFLSGPIMHLVFHTIKPKSFICNTANGTALKDHCPKNDVNQCATILYDSDSTSIITEWNLICSDAYKTEASQSVYMMGLLVGAIVHGYLADVLGRQKVYLYSCLSVAILGTLMSFAPSFEVYFAMRFLIGLNIQGGVLSGYVLLVELIGTKVRGVVTTSLSFFFTIGLVIMSGIAYITHDWRASTFLSSIWGITCIFHFICLPESPRWLLSNGQEKKAKDVMNYIAKGNGRADKLPKNWSFSTDEGKSNGKSLDNIAMLFLNFKLLRYTLIQAFSWFVTSSMYYGLSLAAGNLGDVYINTVLMGLVEIPATFIQIFFINKIGRRKLLCAFMFFGGISCLIIQFLTSEMALARLLFALFGKLCASGQFSVVYIYSAELFPTSIRNGGMGFVTISARIGGIVTPFIMLLGNYVANLHFTVFGAMAFIAGIFNMWLPETNKKPLPTVIQDLLHPPSFDNNMMVMTSVDQFDDDDDIDIYNNDKSKLINKEE